MTAWTKSEAAKFFGMSVAALDHWFLRGAPVERNHNGRISGCYVGDILSWALDQQSEEIRLRAKRAMFPHIALITTRGAFAAIDGPGMMIEAGLDIEAAEATWQSMLRLASCSAAVACDAPGDVLLR